MEEKEMMAKLRQFASACPTGLVETKNLDYQYPKTPLDNAGVEERQKKSDGTAHVSPKRHQVMRIHDTLLKAILP